MLTVLKHVCALFPVKLEINLANFALKSSQSTKAVCEVERVCVEGNVGDTTPTSLAPVAQW